MENHPVLSEQLTAKLNTLRLVYEAVTLYDNGFVGLESRGKVGFYDIENDKIVVLDASYCVCRPGMAIILGEEKYTPGISTFYTSVCIHFVKSNSEVEISDEPMGYKILGEHNLVVLHNSERDRLVVVSGETCGIVYDGDCREHRVCLAKNWIPLAIRKKDDSILLVRSNGSVGTVEDQLIAEYGEFDKTGRKGHYKYSVPDRVTSFGGEITLNHWGQPY